MRVDWMLRTLPIMGKGMLGIFIVIMVIYLVIVVLNNWDRIFGGRRRREKAQGHPQE